MLAAILFSVGDSNYGSGCLCVLASLVWTVFIGFAFPYWRHGVKVRLDLSDSTSWWVAGAGALIFLAISIIMIVLLGRYISDYTWAEDLRWWHKVTVAGTYLLMGISFGAVCRTGNTTQPGAFPTEFPSFLESFLPNPPGWMLLTERIIEFVVTAAGLWSMWVAWRQDRA